MLKRLLKSETGWDGPVLRLTLGLMMLPHGAQKLLGWFGGYGFNGTMQHFTQSMGIPTLFAFLAIATEFFGALALLCGALTRVAAVGTGILMAVAAGFHLDNGFFMNWAGNQQGEGVEFHLLVLGMATALAIRGSGSLGVDRMFETGHERG